MRLYLKIFTDNKWENLHAAVKSNDIAAFKNNEQIYADE